MAVEVPVDRLPDPSTAELCVVSSPNPKPAANRHEEIRTLARIISDQPLPNPEPAAWAVLTAISKNARLRPQGVNMLLTEDENCIGRCVEDRFLIKSTSISANHCKIFRERETHTDGKVGSNIPIAPFKAFLRDTSTNGTFLNWIKLKKNSKAKLTHGDIVSLVSPPHDDNSYSFVYREMPGSNAENSKRKSEDIGNESKRLKGIGIGAPDGPISLDDVRSLQRSNTELRQQLESHVHTIEALQCENRVISTRHENELKELKEAMSNSYYDQIKDLQNLLDAKKKEHDDLTVSSAELQNSIKDLNERLNASLQSRADADEIISSQIVTISELEAQLDEQRNQRKGEREKAEMDLKSAIQKAHLEAQAEIKRQADAYLRQHREQQELITKLQESEKESRLLVEMLRSKLEDARDSLVASEKKTRQLEAQFQDELVASANYRKKMDAMDFELKKLRKELENEKVAREEAWAKVSSLELEIAAAIRDLSTEKQRFQGARERIILRETQLRAFYSTTEEISKLFRKQQEQLKAMQKTLEDEENYECSLFAAGESNAAVPSSNPMNCFYSSTHPSEEDHLKGSSSASTPKNSLIETSCNDEDEDEDDVCATQKRNDSQDGDYADKFPEIDGVGTEVVPELNLTETERIVGTETQAGDDHERMNAAALLKCNNPSSMKMDDEKREDEEVRTADLLASEAVGSWAVDTAPSVNGENESPEDQRRPNDQNNPDRGGVAGISEAHRALSAMIDIVEPGFRRKLRGCADQELRESPSDAETEEGSRSGEEDDDDSTDADGADAMIEDSVG